jgi:hypothetical protein
MQVKARPQTPGTVATQAKPPGAPGQSPGTPNQAMGRPMPSGMVPGMAQVPAQSPDYCQPVSCAVVGLKACAQPRERLCILSRERQANKLQDPDNPRSTP